MSDPRGWIDAGFGASGDMLLAAFIDVGVDLALINASSGAVAPEPTADAHLQRGARRNRRDVAAMLATCGTDSRASPPARHRGALRAAASLDRHGPRTRAAVFAVLAEAKAACTAPRRNAVHFHEVGALDAIADIVGVRGDGSLGLFERLTCSPVAVGSGTVKTANTAPLSVPPPAVAELLRGFRKPLTPTAQSRARQLAPR